MTTKTKKIKNLFPTLKRGGYTCRIRFMDESRGERYFDSEWGVHLFTIAGQFILTAPVNYQGFTNHDNPSGNSIGKSIQAGDSVYIQPTKWNMRGRTPIAGRNVKITNIKIDENGFTELTYE